MKEKKKIEDRMVLIVWEKKSLFLDVTIFYPTFWNKKWDYFSQTNEY